MIRNLNSFQKKKVLGKGLNGTVYLVQNGGQKYALKIEQIKPKHVKKSMSSPHWREIDFARILGGKYPDQFMGIHGYDIKQNNGWRLFSLVDSTLEQIQGKLQVAHLYSGIIQLVNILMLMFKHGFSHNDFFGENIGIKKTGKKYLEIGGFQVPTFGLLYCAIDYGLVLHKKYQLSSDEREIVSDPLLWQNHLKVILDLVLDKTMVRNYYQENKPILALYGERCRKLKSSPAYPVLQTYTSDTDMQLILCHLLFPSLWQQIMYIKQPGKLLKLGYKIPKEDVIFIIMNMSQDKAQNIIAYFALKLERLKCGS